MSKSRIGRVSSFEIDNLADDHTFSKRTKKVTKLAKDPVVDASAVETQTPAQQAPVAPSFIQIGTKTAATEPKKNRSPKKLSKRGANELSRLYGLPVEWILGEEPEAPAQSAAPNLPQEAEQPKPESVKKPKVEKVEAVENTFQDLFEIDWDAVLNPNEQLAVDNFIAQYEPKADDDLSLDIEMNCAEIEDGLGFSYQPAAIQSFGSIADLLEMEYPIENVLSSTSPLHDAVKTGDIKKVEIILSNMWWDTGDLLKTDTNGETALQLAVRLGYADIVDTLQKEDELLILEILSKTAEIEKQNPASDADVNSETDGDNKSVKTRKLDPALREPAKVHPNSMFTTQRVTRNSSKRAATAEAAGEDDKLQAVQEKLEKAARLQQAANQALNSAMDQFKEAKEAQIKSTRKRK